jgi:hypothetical protein
MKLEAFFNLYRQFQLVLGFENVEGNNNLTYLATAGVADADRFHVQSAGAFLYPLVPTFFFFVSYLLSVFQLFSQLQSNFPTATSLHIHFIIAVFA